jgi:AbrB family looped-hinge helix DNA binding protein
MRARVGEEEIMSRVRLLRGGQVTLPAAVRHKLKLAEGDWLEAELVGNGVVLKPVSKAEREKAWQRILDAPKSVRYTGPEPRPTPEEEEEWIAEEIRAARLEEHAKRRR